MTYAYFTLASIATPHHADIHLMTQALLAAGVLPADIHPLPQTVTATVTPKQAALLSVQDAPMTDDANMRSLSLAP